MQKVTIFDKHIEQDVELEAAQFPENYEALYYDLRYAELEKVDYTAENMFMLEYCIDFMDQERVQELLRRWSLQALIKTLVDEKQVEKELVSRLCVECLRYGHEPAAILEAVEEADVAPARTAYVALILKIK